MKHLSEKQLRALAGYLVVDDHLQSCSLCRSRYLQVALGDPHAEYGAALDRALQRLGDRLCLIESEKSSARDNLGRLLSMDERGRQASISEGYGFQTYSLASLVLEECEAWIPVDPKMALRLARLARSIVVRIDPRTCGGGEALADFVAYVIAMEANSLRVLGRLQNALETFGAARAVQAMGGIDPDLESRIDFLESSLRRDLRHFDSARLFLDRATKGFLELEEDKQIVKTLINRSNLLSEQRLFEEASVPLEEALQRTSDPQLVLKIRHNLSVILVKSGSPHEAARLLEETFDLYCRYSDPLTLQHRLWLEGVIVRDLGDDIDRATNLLAEATAGFTESGFGMNATLAGMDLEVLLRRQRELEG